MAPKLLRPSNRSCYKKPHSANLTHQGSETISFTTHFSNPDSSRPASFYTQIVSPNQISQTKSHSPMNDKEEDKRTNYSPYINPIPHKPIETNGVAKPRYFRVWTVRVPSNGRQIKPIRIITNGPAQILSYYQRSMGPSYPINSSRLKKLWPSKSFLGQLIRHDTLGRSNNKCPPSVMST